MTAKRFTFKTKTRGNQAYTQWYDNEKPINSAHEVIDLLNELHEENIMLKGEVAHYKLVLMSLEKEAKRMSQIHCLGDVE